MFRLLYSLPLCQPPYIVSGVFVPVNVKDTATGAVSPYRGGLTVNNPVPTLSALNPSTAIAGSPDIMLALTGTGFSPAGYGGYYYGSGSAVYWNNQYLNTTYVSPTQLTVTVPNSYLANAGTAQVTVYNSPTYSYNNGGGADDRRRHVQCTDIYNHHPAGYDGPDHDGFFVGHGRN